MYFLRYNTIPISLLILAAILDLTVINHLANYIFYIKKNDVNEFLDSKNLSSRTDNTANLDIIGFWRPSWILSLFRLCYITYPIIFYLGKLYR